MPSPTSFKKTSALSPNEISGIRRFLGTRQPFGIYFNAALTDLARGIDNRSFCFNGADGLVMGIDFDGLSVFSTVGNVSSDVMRFVADIPQRAELHIEERYAAEVLPLVSHRLVRNDGLKYYSLLRAHPFPEENADVRLLTKADLPILQEFYPKHYEGTIFSEWMLANPFVGLFMDGQLMSAGGAIVLDRDLRAANVGNFLTATEHRGNGFSKIVVRALVNELIKKDVSLFTLGTVEENVPAWRAYEAVGFTLIGKKRELELRAMAQERS